MQAFLTPSLTNYREQVQWLPVRNDFQIKALKLADISVTIREYSKLGIITGLAITIFSTLSGQIGLRQYAYTLFGGSFIAYLLSSQIAKLLEPMAKSMLNSFRIAKKYEADIVHDEVFATLKQSVSQFISDGEVVNRVTRFLGGVFDHSLASCELEEVDDSIQATIKLKKPLVKLISHPATGSRTLHIPKLVKFRVAENGVVSFGERNLKYHQKDPYCPYVKQVASQLLQVNWYCNKIKLRENGDMRIFGPLCFGLTNDRAGRVAKVGDCNISDIS
jgi:hypothetical protein